jgi:hypothetical protein
MTSVRRIEAELHRKEFGMLGQVGRGATGDPSLFGRKSTRAVRATAEKDRRTRVSGARVETKIGRNWLKWE